VLGEEYIENEFVRASQHLYWVLSTEHTLALGASFYFTYRSFVVPRYWQYYELLNTWNARVFRISGKVACGLTRVIRFIIYYF